MDRKKMMIFIALSIFIGIIALILIVFRNSIFNHKPIPPTPPPTLKKWTCLEGNCTTSTSGTFKDETSCRSGCKTYECDIVNGDCMEAPAGTIGSFVSLKQCQDSKACNWDCSTDVKPVCVGSPGGMYTTKADCIAADSCTPSLFYCDDTGPGCIQSKTPIGKGPGYPTLDVCQTNCKFSCSGGTTGTPGICTFCASPCADGTATNTLDDCNAFCKTDCCWWKCGTDAQGNPACVKSTEADGGKYTTQEQCERQCLRGQEIWMSKNSWNQNEINPKPKSIADTDYNIYNVCKYINATSSNPKVCPDGKPCPQTGCFNLDYTDPKDQSHPFWPLKTSGYCSLSAINVPEGVAITAFDVGGNWNSNPCSIATGKISTNVNTINPPPTFYNQGTLGYGGTGVWTQTSGEGCQDPTKPCNASPDYKQPTCGFQLSLKPGYQCTPDGKLVST